MSKHLLFHMKPKPSQYRRRWQRMERKVSHNLDTGEGIQYPSLSRKDADDSAIIEWSSG